MPNPQPPTQPAADWIYSGIWQILVNWFRVPSTPPILPTTNQDPAQLQSFKPDLGFIKLLKFQFWIFTIIIDLAILVGWVILLIVLPWLGIVLAIPALLLAVVPDIIAFIAIHLRYDTTWYVISETSLRIRRGIWIIHETTITFENIQNVKLIQGPVQRYFGISDLIVETAGGGGSSSSSQHGSGSQNSMAHMGIIQGIANAPELRQRILDKLRATKATGLGDDSTSKIAQPSPITSPAWTPQHLAALNEIHLAIKQLNPSPPQADH